MKDYREKEMKYLLIAYLLLFLFWCTGIFKEFPEELKGNWGVVFSAVNCIVIAGVLSLFTFIADSLFSSHQKEKLVGLFFIPKAGNTIFSRLSSGKVVDDRFTKIEATSYYAHIIEEIPIEKKSKYDYENSQWYKIYCKYQEKGAVSQAQRDYLLCRDLFIETIIFTVLYLITIIVFKEIVNFSKEFLVTLVLVAIITNIATHKKMVRFVNNVIALDIACSRHENVKK